MNVVYLIGNGFDINLGLQTSYLSFLDWYLDIDSENSSEVIKKLMKHMAESKEKGDKYWSDLEIAMGKYTEYFDSFAEMEEAYDDLNEKMQQYISEIEAKGLDFQPDIEHYRKNLIAPEIFLSPAKHQNIIQYYGKLGVDAMYINIISFNYTKNIERILGYKKSECIGSWNHPKGKGQQAHLQKILHIHGCCNQPLMGVNDKDQIANPKFSDAIETQEFLVKPQINQLVGSLVDAEAKTLITNAYIICLFGLSYGETDQIWWSHLKDQILASNKIILFAYEPSVKGITIPGRKVGQIERKHKTALLKACGIPNDKLEWAMSHIYVSLNAPIFDRKELNKTK